MSLLTESVAKLVDEFAKLPGIGKKSAERLAYHVLRVHKTEALGLA
ncbi:MAG TPA: recombination protein RecR, partial [Pirellulales bacterium]|nr:recombination protein RecR [Pirellulales bacterium]